ncbi:MAG: type II secretion system F family protein [Lachnospiraceae bacterium]
MLICGLLLMFCGILWIKFHGYKEEYFSKLPEKDNSLKRVYPIALGLLEFLARHGIRFADKGRKKSIERLNVLKEIKDSELLYNIRRISLVYVIVACTAAFGLFYGISLWGDEWISNGILLRPDYNESEIRYNFLANDQEVQLSLSPVEYEFQQVQNNFSDGYEYLLQMMLGENSSLQQVDRNLNLLSAIPQYAITVRWLTSDVQCVGPDGAVHNENFLEGEERRVTLTAMLSYLDYECQYEIEVTVMAPSMNKEESVLRHLQRIIEETEKEGRSVRELVLPGEVDGVDMKYRKIKENHTLLLVGLGLVAAVGIFLGMNRELDTRLKERQAQMVLDYSEIVSKLNILSGSGMSILRAWEKVVKDYEKKCLEGSMKKRYAYEEMKITYYEIQSGISESVAYAEFGRRCNVHEYLKLGTLLEQNVRKGAKGLSKMLEEEAILAFEQRKNVARKMGEEAGTKLLIPMIIMLAIVMVIVMIPAFTSFQV